MKLKNAVKPILIKAALTNKPPHVKKQNIMYLWQKRLISSNDAIRVIKQEGLKYV